MTAGHWKRYILTTEHPNESVSFICERDTMCIFTDIVQSNTIAIKRTQSGHFYTTKHEISFQRSDRFHYKLCRYLKMNECSLTLLKGKK